MFSKRLLGVPQITLVLLLLTCVSLAAQTQAQKEEKGKVPKQQAPAQGQRQVQTTQQVKPAAGQYSQALFKGMKWREVGPFRGGRVLAVTGIPGDPSTYYFGAVAGGVWKSSNGGLSWTPMMDKQDVSSVGAIAVADSNPNVIYVGSGEACIRGNISFGDGVYKSMDAGKTWKNVGLKDSQHIGAVIVDPHNANRVFVAALGHAYGANAERGIFRTIDGGQTWHKVLYVDDKTGGIDVVFDPRNPNVLFAAMWQALRTPWSLSSGGPGSGLYRSLDGGDTWQKLTGNGLPDGLLGRIGVSVSGADSNRIYALIEAKEAGLYRSDDGGDHWQRVNNDERYTQRAWYFTHIFADPQSANTVYVLNTGLFRSTDAGKSFTLLPAPHGDHHGLWIDPANTDRIINGNDGGATITVDGGKTWTSQLNQPTAQFYHVATDWGRFPYYVYGAQQDNSTIGIASYDDDGVISQKDWYDVGGGESGYIAPDPQDYNTIYAGGNQGTMTRYNHLTRQAQDVSPWPLDYSGHGADDMKYRLGWTEPIVISASDPNTIYTAGNVVFRSTDRGMSWSVISPDLTRNDKSKQQPSGGPITKDNTSVEYYDTIFTIAESPKDKNTVWAGTDDGLVWITRDGGANWNNVTPKGAWPEWSLVSLIDASPHDPGTAYVAIDTHKLDNIQPFLFVTRDYGKSWSRIDNGIPRTTYTHVVREDPVRKGLLFAGTENGFVVSFNDGGLWQPLQLNLPQTPIHDLTVKDNDLIVATHGRSFWILDDILPLREINEQLAGSDVLLYKPAPALRLHAPEEVNRRQPVGENPPIGAVIDYYFATAPKSEVMLDILDAQGKLVRHYSSKKKEEGEQPPEWPDLVVPSETIPVQAGMNRFAWNLKYDSPVKVPGAFYSGNGPEGPYALPGNYTAKLTANGKSYTVPVELRLDPRVKVSTADLQKQFELSMRVRGDINRLHEAVNQMREVRAQLKTLEKRFGDSAQAKPILNSAQELDKKMTPVEGVLIQYNMKSSEGNLNWPNMLNESYDSLSHSIEYADGAPTQQQYAVADALEQQLNTELAKWQQIVQTDVATLNNTIRQQSLPAIYVGPGMPMADETKPAAASQ